MFPSTEFQKKLFDIVNGPSSVQSITSKIQDAIIAAILAEIDDCIDRPMVTGLTVPQSHRLWIARRASQRVMDLVMQNKEWWTVFKSTKDNL
jgi:hypothetical protein